MKKKLLITLFIMSAFKINAQQVSFSIQAHQDDWQLFMSTKILADLSVSDILNPKMVFITFTAGDEGNGVNAFGAATVPYYLAREKGSLYSSKFASDISGGILAIVPTVQIATVNGHKISKYIYGKTVNYFLRLPDGNTTGAGYANTGFESLQRLQTRKIKSISSIDRLTKYTSWSDLTNTIKAIIVLEKGNDNQVWMYTPSLNTTNNPGDHSDHKYASTAVQDAVKNMLWVGIDEFINFQSSALADNLNVSDHEDAAAIFSVCDRGLIESKYSSTFNAAHKAWLPMEYHNIKRSPTGSAPFAPIFESLAEDNSSSVISGRTDGLTEIPMLVSVVSPVSVGNNIKMLLKPSEPGQLNTFISDLYGKLLYQKNTKVENTGSVVISLDNPSILPGVYIVKNILNGKYVDSKKIVIQ